MDGFDARSSLAWFGALISLYGTVLYMIGIWKHGTRPRLASWIAWAVSNAVLMIMAVRWGAYQVAVFNAIAGAANLGVLILAARRRVGDAPKGSSDWSCLVAALGCMVVMLMLPHMGMLCALLAMMANAIATWPTIRHAWHKPHAETWQLFAANAIAASLALVSVQSPSLQKVAGPLMATAGNITLTSVATLRRPWVRRRTRQLVTELETELQVAATGTAAEIEE
jgi:hypothetical protein